MRERGFVWIVVTAALLYGASCSRYYVGHFSDDARDILAAKGLLTGHYVNLQLPGHPPLNFPLPGFPLFLSPFVALFQPHWSWLRIVPLAMTTACIVALWFLFRPWLSHRFLLVFLALFSFNPCTVMVSGRVIADSCYLFFVLVVLLVLRRQLFDERSSRAWILGILTGWAALVRPEGVLLVPSIGSGLAVGRRWRSLGHFLAASLVILMSVALRNHFTTGSASGYASIWSATLPLLSGRYDELFRNILRLVQTTSLELILSVLVSSQGMAGGVAVGGSLMIITSVVGLASFSQRKDVPSGITFAIFLFCFGHLFLHAFWLALDAHYLWPILPFLLVFLIEGFRVATRGWPHRYFWRGFLLVPVALVYLWQDGFAIQQTIHKPLENQPPIATFQWIQTHLPSTALLLTPNAPSVSLNTGHYTLAFVPSWDAESFRYQLLKGGVTHVLWTPTNILYVRVVRFRDPIWVWGQTRTWLRSKPEAFRLIYENASESTMVYQLIPG